MDPRVKQREEGIVISIKVIPKAARSAIVGWENELLKVRLKAVPEKGEANRELIAFLATTLHCPKSHLTLLSGETSRHKKVLITHMDEETFLSKIFPKNEA